MIKYNLKCENDHNFDAWFSDSSNFEKQNQKNLILCPKCSSTKIEKNIMAPNIGSKKQSYTNALKTEKNIEKIIKMFASMSKKIMSMLEINLLMKQEPFITERKRKEKFTVKLLLKKPLI